MGICSNAAALCLLTILVVNNLSTGVALDGLKLQLIHRDHELSVARGSNGQTLHERQRKALDRGRSRHRRLSGQLLGKLGNYDENENNFDTAVLPTSESSQQTAAASWPVFAHDWEYGMIISVGTPARQFTFIADTGSFVVWLQCKPCSNCAAQTDDLYDPASSHSYKPIKCSDKKCHDGKAPGKPSHRASKGDNYCHSHPSDPCPYKLGYADGSKSAGVLATETIEFNSSDNKTVSVDGFEFGCGHNQSGDFSGMDGMVGLGWSGSSLVKQLSPKTGKSFSYCLVPYTDAVTKTSPFILGHVSPPPGMQYTSFLASAIVHGAYVVGLEGIGVGKTKLPLPPPPPTTPDGKRWTLVDSGSSVTTLEPAYFDSMLKAIKKQMPYPKAVCPTCERIGFNPDACFDISKGSNVVYPSITFHFTGADLVLPPENSFTLVEESIVCLTYLRGEMSRKGLGLSILGNYQQQNFIFTYDLEKNRLGFAEGDCD